LRVEFIVGLNELHSLIEDSLVEVSGVIADFILLLHQMLAVGLDEAEEI
jgi:hypothetical protein